MLTGLAAAGIDTSRIPFATRAEVRAAIEARGLGGSLDMEAPDKLYTGHEISEAVCEILGLVPAGRIFHGRGSAHRANIEQIRALGVR